jgi:aspartyl-tRNA(Asn)/glutamyl-tRNA(Gln) amidotransferase subunit B
VCAFLVSAIDYEVDRQIALLEAGEQVEQETRAFDSRSSQTVRLRTKEQAVDYRFMPEPDLPPLHVSTESLAAWSRELPPLPAQLQAQLESECAMSARDALAVIDEPGALVYLKRLIDCGVEPAIAAKWLLNDVIAHAHAHNIDIARFPISADRLAELINEYCEWRADGRGGEARGVAAPVGGRHARLARRLRASTAWRRSTTPSWSERAQTLWR